MKAIERIKLHEGFRDNVYLDSLGFPTIGYGTKLPITEEEASVLLGLRLNIMKTQLEDRISHFPIEIQDVLIEMAYQMGVKGLLNFVNMFHALNNKDYKMAADEMLDSRWYEQTPKRAEELAEIIRNYNG